MEGPVEVGGARRWARFRPGGGARVAVALLGAAGCDGACLSDLRGPSPRAGTIAVVEAEDLRGDWPVQTNLAGYRGSGFRVSNAAGTAPSALEGSVELAPGQYAVWVRAFRDEEDRSFALRVADVQLQTTHGPHEGQPGFAWERAGQANVVSERVRLELRDAGAGFETPDAILLIQNLNFDPQEDSQAADPLDSVRVRDGVADDLLRRLRRRILELPDLAEADDPAAHQSALRRRLRTALGLERLVLAPAPDVQVHAQHIVDGIRVETITFETFSGTRVPGLMLRPEIELSSPAGARPAVLSPVGHYFSMAQVSVLTRTWNLARQGFVVLSYDPWGEGERPRRGNDHWDQPLWSLSGVSNAAIHVAEASRALDVLLGQTDVDPRHVGITGFSLGGLISAYTAAVDERVTMAAPGGFLAGFDAFASTRQMHDPCSYPPGLLSVADMRLLGELVAPRPMVLLGGSRDAAFPLSGMRQVVTDVGRAYAALGGSPPELVAGPQGHDGMGPSLRAAMYRFFMEQAQGRTWNGSEVEPPKAFVGVQTGLRRLELEKVSMRERSAAWVRTSTRTLDELVGDWRAASDRRPTAVEAYGAYGPLGGPRFRRWIVRSGPIETMAFTHRIPGSSATVVLVLPAEHDFGRSLSAAARLGLSVVGLRVRRAGPGWREQRWVQNTAELTGAPLPWLQAEDIVEGWKALADRFRGSGPAVLVPVGRAEAFPSLLAAGTSTEFSAVLLPAHPEDFRALWDLDDVARDRWTVPGLREVTDLPELLARARASGPAVDDLSDRLRFLLAPDDAP